MDIKKFIEYVVAGEVPIASPTQEELDRFNQYSLRSQCTSRGMWAIVDLTWTKKLAEWIGTRKVLEVMAGHGWLAKALHSHGVDVIATDNNSWENTHRNGKSMFDVIRMDGLEAVKKFSDRDILLVSWPPYEDKAIEKICKNWKGIVIYIGEECGCNAGAHFFRCFQEIEAPEFEIPVWGGMHDRVLVGTYSHVEEEEEDDEFYYLNNEEV